MARKRYLFKQAPISERNKQHILDILKEEGLTEEQINEMPWENVWKLYLDSITEIFDRELSIVNSAMKRNPQLTLILGPAIKTMASHVKDLAKFAEEAETKRKKK